MELDLSELKFPGALPLAALVVIAGLLFALLGRVVSPDRLLTWSEWQVLQQSRAYTKELATINSRALELADLVNSSPDAVRASVARDKACRLTGLDALAGERDALCAAAGSVLAWAQGDVSQAQAADAVDAVLTRLNALGSGNE